MLIYAYHSRKERVIEKDEERRLVRRIVIEEIERRVKAGKGGETSLVSDIEAYEKDEIKMERI